MASNVNLDPVRAHAVFEAWGKLSDATVYDPAYVRRGGPVKMAGHDLLDGAGFSLLKAEFLAAQAGVVPFMTLPGGGKGVMTVGGALAARDDAWPQPELKTLYLLNHKGAAALHSSTNKARVGTPPLTIPATSPSQAQDMALFYDQVGAGAANLGVVPPVAWLVVAAVGILATMAASYYATRTKLEEIQVDAALAKHQYAVGNLTDLAQQQLATTGKIDPALIGAIKNTGSDSAWLLWPYIAIGAGALIAGGAGTWWVLRGRKRRR